VSLEFFFLKVMRDSVSQWT